MQILGLFKLTKNTSFVMPIYEFYSPDTNRIYSFYARRLMPKAIPRCPDGPQFRMQRIVSSFAVIGRAKDPSENPDSPQTNDDLDLNPRQEAAMREMMREIESMGDTEPDPRTLGKMMRRFLDLSGQKAPGELEEMLSRLEKGEDPEKLEEEFGDAFENMEDMFGFGDDKDPSSQDPKEGRLRSLLRRTPTRDPNLYEMADYLDPTPQPRQ